MFCRLWNICVCRKISGSTYYRQLYILVKRFMYATFATRRKKKRWSHSAQILPNNFVLTYWKLTLKTFLHQMMRPTIRITFLIQINKKKARKRCLFTFKTLLNQQFMYNCLYVLICWHHISNCKLDVITNISSLLTRILSLLLRNVWVSRNDDILGHFSNFCYDLEWFYVS